MLQNTVPKHINRTGEFCADMGAVTGQSVEDIQRANLRAQGGLEIATNYTSNNQKPGARLTELQKQRRIAAMQSCSNTIKSVEDRLSGWDLNDDRVQEADGILKIEDENGNIRNLTLEEKTVLENNHGACSTSLAQEEVDINHFMNGKNNTPPDVLLKMAEEKGLNPDTMDRDDYANLVREKFPNGANKMLQSQDIKNPMSLDEGKSVLDMLNEKTPRGNSEADWDKVSEKTDFITDPLNRLSNASPAILAKEITTSFNRQPNFGPSPEAPGLKIGSPALQQKLALNQFQPTGPTEA